MQASSQAAVHDNTISQNTATTGGGVFMTAVSQATLNTNQVERNQASQGHEVVDRRVCRQSFQRQLATEGFFQAHHDVDQRHRIEPRILDGLAAVRQIQAEGGLGDFTNLGDDGFIAPGGSAHDGDGLRLVTDG